jgi:uncharacterized repeat protein (TIGR02543 family)
MTPFFSFFPAFLATSFLPSAQATQYTWSNPSQPPSGNWHALAMSSDGTKIVGAVYGGQIWTSIDSGVTWLNRGAAGAESRKWIGIAVSQASDVIYGVVDQGGGVYRSPDFGLTWYPTSAPICNYVGVATSGAANVSVACGGSSGEIYVNRNAGDGAANTWTASSGLSNLNITDIKSSSDGSKLIASVWEGGVYTADDGTFAYVNKLSSPMTGYLWSAVGINSDGTKLIATARGTPNYPYGNVFTSVDSGATWVASSGANGANQGGLGGDWMNAAISADGSTLMAVAFGSPAKIIISRNSGATWTLQQTDTGSFIEAAMCASGGRLTSAVYGGKIFQTVANEATLSGLALSVGTLSTTFNSCNTNYSATVANSVSSGFTITPTKSQSDATIIQYLGATGTTIFTGDLSIGANIIRTIVTAQDGSAMSTYTVTVTRAAVVVSDATLFELSLSSGTLSPTFSSGTTTYTAIVANSVSSGFTITPTKSQSDATFIQYLGESGTTAFSGDLSVGANIIRTVVTAPDGVAKSTFTVTVTRAQFSAITWNDQGATTASSGGSTSYSNGLAVASIPTSAPQKTGHTFNGWFTSTSSGAQVTNGAYTPPSPYGDMTFYAHWTANRSSTVGTWVWENQSDAGTRKWHALSTSAEGSKLFAGVDNGGSLYRSTDFGDTWSVIPNTSGHNWFSVSSNIDGTKVAAVDRGGDIWTSTDSGTTWTQRVVGGSVRNWESIASSSDGEKLVAVASNGDSNGFIFTSSDSGATWSNNLAPSGTNKFTGVASSNEGKYLAATTWASGVYTSADFGATWTLRALPVPNVGGETHLQAVASSGDGSRLVTGSRLSGASNGGIIFTSADYGASWKAYAQANFDYINFASNGDGSRLAATIYGQPGVSTSADFGATWSFQSVGANGQISIASNIDGSLLFVGGYGGNLWTGKIPNSRVAAVLPSATSANLMAAANAPATAITFSAVSAAAAMTLTPISNPTTDALTPFDLAQATLFDISVVNVIGEVTICVDGGPNLRLWHYTNGSWVDVTTSQTATQICGLTSSFSPFATAPPVPVVAYVPPSPVPVVAYVPPSPVPYLKTVTAPQIRKSGSTLICSAGTYNAGYTLGGVIQGSDTSLYTPTNYIFNLLFNLVMQNSLMVMTSMNNATWDANIAPSGALVTCSVTVTANSITNSDASSVNSASVSAALTIQSQSVVSAENAYNAVISANSKSYQKTLVDNRAAWRAKVDEVRADYLAELNRINGLPNSKANRGLKSSALKTYIAAQKKTAVDYKASGPAALAVRNLANKEALDIKKAAIAKANAVYGAFIESIGYGVLIP